MSKPNRWTLCALLAAALLAGSPMEGAGQDHGDVPTFLVMPESFPDVDGRAVLLREPGRDIVLLREADATPETLSVALALLRRLNGSTPRAEGQGQMVPLTGYVLREALPEARRAELDAALRRLREQVWRPIGNLGVGRSIPFRDGDG
jgi:hypothetical protein